MIDTWLLTVFCLIILSIFAFLRILPGPTRDDRFVAGNAAITITAGAALGLSIYWGNLVILDSFILLIALSYAGTIALARSRNGEKI